MDVTAIGNLIGSLGFPIVMCFLFFNYIKESDRRNDEKMSEVVKSINNNTVVISSLITALNNNNVIAKQDFTGVLTSKKE